MSQSRGQSRAQSRALSLAEALCNGGVGICTVFALQLMVFPAFGLHPTLGQSLKIGLSFAALSVLRSYALRRLFTRAHPELW
jgi:hypothetical protein